jgi:hypothetical protein
VPIVEEQPLDRNVREPHGHGIAAQNRVTIKGLRAPCQATDRFGVRQAD